MAPDAETALETASVLLFHLDKESRGTLLDSLRACGFKTPWVADKPGEAIHQLITKHYDVILVYYAGKTETVEQFIDEVKSLEAIAETPLLAITSDASPKNVLRIMSKELDRVLITPLSRKAIQEALQGSLWLDPKDITHISLQDAKNHELAGEWELAEADYKRILKQDPHRVEALMGMATSLLQRRQSVPAVEYLKEAMKAAKQLSNIVEQHRFLSLIYFNLGGHFSTLGAHEQAIKHYKAALKLNPFAGAVLPQLIPLMAKTGSIDEILSYLDEITENYPPFSSFRDTVSETLSELLARYIALNIQENIDRIHAYLLTLQHSNINLHLKTIDYLLGKGQHTAIKVLLEQLLIKIKDADLMVRLADLYMSDLHPDSNPKKSPLPTVDKTYLQDKPADFWLKQSHGLYKNALLLEPFEVSIWLKMLRCHLLMKEFDTAGQMLERMFENMTVGMEEHAETCTILIREKAYDLAKKYINTGLNQYPKESRFHFLASQMHNAEGNHYEAVTALKTGLREHPDSIDCLTELGTTYGLLKNWSQAVEFYEKALQLSPANAELQQLVQTALQAKYRSQGT